MTTNRRTTVTITPEEAEAAERVTYQGSPEAVALHALTGRVLGERPTQATLVHALVDAGLKAIENHVLEAAYARAAEFDRNDPEAQEWHRAMRARRRRGAAAA